MGKYRINSEAWKRDDVINHKEMLTGRSGWDEGSASAITQLKSFQREFNMTPEKDNETLSNIISLVNLTAGVGALLSCLLNDRLGRLWSLRLYSTIVAVGTLISTFSYGKLGALYVGRLVSGLGIGALTVTGPMSIVEIAPRVTRGLMTLWFNLGRLFCPLPLCFGGLFGILSIFSVVLCGRC